MLRSQSKLVCSLAAPLCQLINVDDFQLATHRLNGKVRHYGQIRNRIDAIDKLVAKLKHEAGTLKFVYEAGPCGLGLYRHLTRKKHQCTVVAPSFIPKKPRDLSEDVSVENLAHNSL